MHSALKDWNMGARPTRKKKDGFSPPTLLKAGSTPAKRYMGCPVTFPKEGDRIPVGNLRRTVETDHKSKKWAKTPWGNIKRIDQHAEMGVDPSKRIKFERELWETQEKQTSNLKFPSNELKNMSKGGIGSVRCRNFLEQVSTTTFVGLWGFRFQPLLLGTFGDTSFCRYFWELFATLVSTATVGDLWGHRFQPLLFGNLWGHRFQLPLLGTFGDTGFNRYFWDTGFHSYF